jgi:hypothetical protein
LETDPRTLNDGDFPGRFENDIFATAFKWVQPSACLFSISSLANKIQRIYPAKLLIIRSFEPFTAMLEMKEELVEIFTSGTHSSKGCTASIAVLAGEDSVTHLQWRFQWRN